MREKVCTFASVKNLYTQLAVCYLLKICGLRQFKVTWCVAFILHLTSHICCFFDVCVGKPRTQKYAFILFLMESFFLAYYHFGMMIVKISYFQHFCIIWSPDIKLIVLMFIFSCKENVKN